MRLGSSMWCYLASKASRPRQWLARHGVRTTPSQRRLAALRDAHVGRRAFVLGNGPSLAVADLDRLRHEVTFASNKIYLAFDQTGWRPTYYHVSDVLVAEHNRERINALPLTKLFARCVYRPFADRRDVTWLDELPPPADGQAGFSEDCTIGVHGGFTVVYHQLQLAWHMGIREVYLLGLDFSFAVPGRSTGTSAHGRVLASEGEQNHFHQDYRKPGEPWTEPRLDRQREAFAAARQRFEAGGGKLLNASRQTKLDVLPRVSLDEVLAGLPLSSH